MKEYISFIDFTNMSDEEKYKLLNSKDYEIERLKKMIKAEEKISNLLPDETDFIIVRREDYNRLFGSDKEC